jgi:hypothetical protein
VQPDGGLGTFGFTCTSGLPPTFGGAVCAKALVAASSAVTNTVAIFKLRLHPTRSVSVNVIATTLGWEWSAAPAFLYREYARRKPGHFPLNDARDRK